MRWTLVAIVFGCSALIGCASYVAPGRGANMGAFGISQADREANTDASIQVSLDKKPLAGFPASIAIVRVESPGYESHTANSYGSGAYSVVTTRDVEKPEQLDRMLKLPMIQGIAPVNQLLLSSNLQSDRELRQAAAMLHADFLLIYTFDTTFYVRDFAKPLSVITLGLSPNENASVVTTASAVLMDTRNGYVYGVDETTARTNQIASAWTSDDAVDDARLRTEGQAFDQLVGEFEKTWKGVVQQYGGQPAVVPAAAASGIH